MPRIPFNSHLPAHQSKTTVSCLLKSAGQILPPCWNILNYYSLNWHNLENMQTCTIAMKGKSMLMRVLPQVSDFRRKNTPVTTRSCLAKWTSRTWTWKCLKSLLNVLGKSLNLFGYDHVVFKNPGTPRWKISHRPLTHKSWQIYSFYQSSIQGFEIVTSQLGVDIKLRRAAQNVFWYLSGFLSFSFHLTSLATTPTTGGKKKII